MRIKMLAGVLAAVVAAVSMRGDDIIGNLPAGTAFAARLDLEKLRSTKLYEEAKAKHKEKFDELLQKMEAEAGINPLSVKAAWMAAEKKDHGIIILTGAFDAEKISQKLAGKEGFEKLDRKDCLLALMCPDKKNKNVKNLAVLLEGGAVIAAGKPELVEKFLANTKGGKERIDEDSAAALRKSIPEKQLFEAALLKVAAEEAEKNPLAAGLKFAELSVGLEKDLVLNMKVTMADEEQAEAVAQIAKGMSVLGKRSKKGDERRRLARENFLGNLMIDRKGADITASSKIDGETLNQLIEWKKEKE